MRPCGPDNILRSPFGTFTLRRYPALENDRLRAWDAADEYLLNHVACEVAATGRLLLLNDFHGALSTSLHKHGPVSWGDSVASFRAAQENRRRNRIDAAPVSVPSTKLPEGNYDLVLIKIPKTTALLQYQLIKLRRRVHDRTIIIGAGMVKHLQKSAFAVFENCIGPVTTSLAEKKARLLFSSLNKEMKIPSPPESITWCDPDLDFSLENLPNVFSRESLDHGARFFLSAFNKLPQAKHVIDLGCGNGVLGISLKKMRPDSRVTFTDESFFAVESARRNYSRLIASGITQAHTDHFSAEYGLETQASESAELILCNPPFHQQHTVGRQVAWSMFTDSKRVLSRGGQLWVVANRHLDYQAGLKARFGNCSEIAVNRKFRVLRVIKR